MRSDNVSGVTGLARVRSQKKGSTLFHWKVVWCENKKVRSKNFAYGHNRDERSAFYLALDLRHRMEEKIYGSSSIDLNAREKLFQNAYKHAEEKLTDKRHKIEHPPTILPWWYEEV